MTIALQAVEVRSARRLRLAFTESVASGAFSIALYGVVSNDAVGSSPSVIATFAVTSSPHVVELALGEDLVGGGQYTVSAVGVPALAGGSTPAGTESVFRPGSKPTTPQAQTPQDDLLADAFGEDLVWNGEDMEEAPSGDLATVAGRANAQAALERAMVCDGLPWDRSWGAHPREFVDGSSLEAYALVGSMTAQALRDDRVVRATAKALPGDENAPEQTFIELQVEFVDGSHEATQVPVQTT